MPVGVVGSNPTFRRMRCTIDAKALSQSLAVVLPAISSRATVDSLRSALFAADGDEVVIAATDMEIGVKVTTEAQVETRGLCLVPADRLKAIADLSEGSVELTLAGTHVVVMTTAGMYHLPTSNVADWPASDEAEGDPTFEVDAAALGVALDRVVFAAARDEGKYAMRGVLWDVNLSELSLAATDGKRLAIVEVKAQALARVCLLPTKAMGMLGKLCTSGTVKVWLPAKVGLAHFHTDAGQLSTRLVEGRFPPYREVIPKKKDIAARATMQAGPFLHAVRSAALMSDDESKRVEFVFDGGKVCLAAQGATTGKADVTFTLDQYTGPPLTVSLDPQYVIDFLKVMPAEENLTLEMVAGDKSVVFRYGGGLCLIVPLV